ncbi:thioredoxin family protein [Segetibacter sp. 3557_3]|uniref:thioredoxin family protein n=1 Tax=Segetibacter sp. 3557_3 TaxID=2547429 RepID=UPI001058434A|nr:thioredoxin family protein [Segetibacter sp. 3557_3]TDH26401.1 thioredoxin family protein [Segetibacter sp. 3557_3]
MRTLSICLLVALFTAPAIAQQFTALKPGAKVPLADVKMKAVDGKEFSIKDAMGKNGVLVMFSCNTCPVVKKYQGRTLQAIRTAEENGIGVLIVNANEANRNSDDSFEAMKQYAKAQGYQNAPYVVDTKSALANAFGATRTPECFLFNAKQELVYHGAIDDNQEAADAQRNHLAIAMTEVKSGRDVAVKQTRSVGCGIKRAE